MQVIQLIIIVTGNRTHDKATDYLKIFISAKWTPAKIQLSTAVTFKNNNCRSNRNCEVKG